MIREEFKRDDQELAALGEERFERTGLVLLGTLRKDGWPRISPVEPLIAHGQLYRGMMWQSRKALDLLREPRCTAPSPIDMRLRASSSYTDGPLTCKIWTSGVATPTQCL